METLLMVLAYILFNGLFLTVAVLEATGTLAVWENRKLYKKMRRRNRR